jgi:hypothetical protein
MDSASLYESLLQLGHPTGLTKEGLKTRHETEKIRLDFVSPEC